MNYRKAGSLPFTISALGFGCMRLPRRRFFPMINERYATEIIRHGIDLGINYLDSAWIYPQSESILGNALADGYREKVHIATKLPMILVRKQEDFDRYLDEQLQRLKTDHIDVYLFHMLNQSNFAKVKKFNLIEKMEQAKKAGKIRHIGFSFHDTLPVFKEIIDFYPWELTMVQYNYMDTAVQATTEGLQYAHAKGVAIIAMEPLKGGQLVHPPAEALKLMHASPVKRTPIDWALQFLWNRPEIACVLSGMNSKKMVDDNCTSAAASGIGLLSAEEQTTLDHVAEIYRRNIIVPCTSCNYCMPCAAGVNIPQNFALLNNKSFAAGGKFAGKLMQWLIIRNYGKLTKKETGGGNNRRASSCIKCNVCIPKCPQKIMIPEELAKVTAVFEGHAPIDSVRRR